jgi:hypothetical protein
LTAELLRRERGRLTAPLMGGFFALFGNRLDNAKKLKCDSFPCGGFRATTNQGWLRPLAPLDRSSSRTVVLSAERFSYRFEALSKMPQEILPPARLSSPLSIRGSSSPPDLRSFSLRLRAACMPSSFGANRIAVSFAWRELGLQRRLPSWPAKLLVAEQQERFGQRWQRMAGPSL